MPIKFRCTSCNRAVEAPAAAFGKKAKCPTCGHLMAVPKTLVEADPLDGFDEYMRRPQQAQQRYPDTVPVVPQPVQTAPGSSLVQIAVAPNVAAEHARLTTSQWLIPIVTALIGVCLGYFIGREHLRYQIAERFSDFGRSFASDVKEMSAGIDRDEVQVNVERNDAEGIKTGNNPVKQLSEPKVELPAAAPQLPTFIISNTTVKAKGFGMATVVGEITNTSSRTRSASLIATFYGKDGSITGTAQGAVLGVQPGQKKTFELMTMDDLEGTKNYKVAVDVSL
jgi:DNA-directed RNA polymerase subunit RPC12/RpoP